MSILHTERLILRPFRDGDAKAMYQNWTFDERVAKFCRWFPHQSLAETEEFLQFCLTQKNSWAITLKETGEPIGSIDVVGVNDAGVPEIGYVLSHDYWGKGIMTEAVLAVLRELFANGFERIEACHAVENPASGRVMQKCGMSYVRNAYAQRKFGSDEQCEVRYYQIDKPTFEKQVR